jgi:hypothetical protein
MVRIAIVAIVPIVAIIGHDLLLSNIIKDRSKALLVDPLSLSLSLSSATTAFLLLVLLLLGVMMYSYTSFKSYTSCTSIASSITVHCTQPAVQQNL